jgi:hypothetical protein
MPLQKVSLQKINGVESLKVASSVMGPGACSLFPASAGKYAFGQSYFDVYPC